MQNKKIDDIQFRSEKQNLTCIINLKNIQFVIFLDFDFIFNKFLYSFNYKIYQKIKSIMILYFYLTSEFLQKK